ncbi:unnamed protein product [Sordaria macrospora k-hell]|uniref:WGS project CABT00000000 data, contig 2.38 n=1 Tax=Sordaria macrospora (strain ATCC MYA-333 / DSM 997 / K(L3346) / K-hell) TaxID=771870 RepID=F7W784_SORMK|nr:uncharacterized protein SMAC_06873 [Sordaria macrospora k-hell]CCC13375.1 unnamed protein product [Sordaria macrospora k-hell]
MLPAILSIALSPDCGTASALVYCAMPHTFFPKTVSSVSPPSILFFKMKVMTIRPLTMSFPLTVEREGFNVYWVTITSERLEVCVLHTCGPAWIHIEGEVISRFVCRGGSGVFVPFDAVMMVESRPVRVVLITEGVTMIRVQSPRGAMMIIFDRLDAEAASQGQEAQDEEEEEEEDEYVPPSP